MLGNLTLPRVIELVSEWCRRREASLPIDDVIALLEGETGVPNVEEDFLIGLLIHGDYDSEYVAERLIHFNPDDRARRMTRDEMINLVKEIMSVEGTEAEEDDRVDVFAFQCQHPAGTDLIFWPNLVPELEDVDDPTAAQIVDLAMRSNPRLTL